MMAALVALAGRLERRSSGLLALVKLANVGLAMAWGFVVTFVFVRLLPIGEFRSFLLLVAFANFTVSAELGLCAIAYSRLRRGRVVGEGGFHPSEITALLWLLAGIVLAGALLIGGAIALGLIRTRYPALFLTFYAANAVNLVAVLARRALAALDHNLWWEVLDCLRRGIGIALLLASLIWLPILESVLAQLVLALLLLWAGLATIHASLAMRARDWMAWRSGAAHVRAHYLDDFWRTGALTIFDVTAYNAPYFTIVAATPDPRPLLLFDFVFKMSRALSSVIRALIETMLPGLTRAWFGRERATFRKGLARATLLTFGVALGGIVVLMLLGRPLAHAIFDGHAVPTHAELAAMALLQLGLWLMCVSVYLQNGLGRFGALVGPSFLFLIGSLASVPLSVLLAARFGWPAALTFLALYALVHGIMGAIHARMLLRLDPEARA